MRIVAEGGEKPEDKERGYSLTKKKAGKSNLECGA